MLANLNTFSWPKLGRLAASALLAATLAACGGGGGNPGAVGGTPTAPGTGTGTTPGTGTGNTIPVASVTLATSATTIAASGADGTEVTLTAIVKDANNNALQGATVVAFSLFSAAANRFLNLELSALEADGKGKIISSPRVVTEDKMVALIEQGVELPYQVATSSGATSITFKKAVLRLEVTPQITPDGNVVLEVEVNKDSKGDVTPAGFAINNQHVKTKVRVENGGTVMLGGIYQQSERSTDTKVPLLGDLPVLGYLFKTTGRETTKTELLVFLTPKIVADSIPTR